MERTGRAGSTTSSSGLSDTLATGTKFLAGSYSRLRVTAGMTASVLTLPNRSVYPSGSAFTTVLTPITPPAPARFSTTTLCPNAGAMRCRHQPGHQIDRPPWRERDHDLDHPIRIGLGSCWRCSAACQRGEDRRGKDSQGHERHFPGRACHHRLRAVRRRGECDFTVSLAISGLAISQILVERFR